MIMRTMLTVVLCVAACQAIASEDIKIPAEVTPGMRAACESDVRRLCISSNSTVETVRQCVLAKFMKLGKRCQMEIASAGLAP